MWETFVYVSFELYQKPDKIEIKADHNQESRSKTHTALITVRNIDGYPLVLSQGQLTEP